MCLMRYIYIYFGLYNYIIRDLKCNYIITFGFFYIAFYFDVILTFIIYIRDLHNQFILDCLTVHIIVYVWV